MGKTTLYHPVSLYVIRASLIRCGITPGRIKQLAIYPQSGEAVYSTTIDKLPKEIRYEPLHRLIDMLESCFAGDVIVESLADTYTRNRQGRKVRMCFRTFADARPGARDTINVPKPETSPSAPVTTKDDLSWLVDVEDLPRDEQGRPYLPYQDAAEFSDIPF